MQAIEEWFKIKKYPHIGKPITIKDYNYVQMYVNNTENIRKHSFLPYIHKIITKRKFRANKTTIIINPSGKRERIKEKPKERHIYFSAHLDAMIFSKYNTILATAYEKYIEYLPFNESIVAYRKIPVIKGKNGNKCNIEFAKTAFEFIKSNKESTLSVIVADITHFFDNLNHKILKKKWAEVLQETSLPGDHFNLYKALTRIKYVEANQLFDASNRNVYVERGVPNLDKKKEQVKKKINDVKYFKEKNVVYYCDKKEFVQKYLGLIKSNNNIKGIPQGSPISATLANIYMLDFDRIIFEKIKLINGFYQRYSDDLIIVCERQYEDEILKLMNDAISGKYVKLNIEQQKTKLYHFEIIDGFFKGFSINERNKELNNNKPLEYLGFSFDGQKVLIKNSGFSKFYRSMKRAFSRGTYFAIYSKNPDNSLFKSRLYNRFTYKGAKGKLIHRPLKNNPKVFKPSREYNWGNYLTYINKANATMRTINMDDSIKKQSRKVWCKFHKLLRKHEHEISIKTNSIEKT